SPIPITPPGAAPAAPPAAAEPQGFPPALAPAGPGATTPGPAATGGSAYPTAGAVNAAEFVPGATIDPDKPDAMVLKLQILLDRAGFSPGVIDGYAGRNVAKAIQVAEVVLGLPPDGQLDPDVWLALSVTGGRSTPVLAGYTITPEDAA